MFTEKELAAMSLEKLRCKRDQAWDMAGLARQDSDHADAAVQTANARQLAHEIYNLAKGGESIGHG